MIIASIAGRLLLASVFVVAGVAKALDTQRARGVIRQLGLPKRLALAVEWLLPGGEVVLGSLLILAPSIRIDLAAAVLLTVLTLGFGVAMAREHGIHCRCFGEIFSSAGSEHVLVRNTSLLLIAGFLTWTDIGLPVATADTARLMDGHAYFGGVVIGGLTLASIAATRRFGSRDAERGHTRPLTSGRSGNAIAEQPQAIAGGLTLGSTAPEFALEGLSTDCLTLQDLLALGRPLILIFSDPTCATCEALLRQVGRWQSNHANRVTVAVINRGARSSIARHARTRDLFYMLVEGDSRVTWAYRYAGTPSAILIDEVGCVASDVASGPTAVFALLAKAD